MESTTPEIETKKTVFLLVFVAGYGDSLYEKNLKVYADRKTAQYESDRRNAETSRIEGMLNVIGSLMNDWEKAHPDPYGLAYSEHQDWSHEQRKEAEAEWRKLRQAEFDRLDALTGTKDLAEKFAEEFNISRHYLDEGIHFHVEEIEMA